MVRSMLVHHAKRKSSFSSLVIVAHCLPAAGAAIAASHLLPAAGPPAVTIRPPFRNRAKAVTLICRETVEQPRAAGALKPILATVARGMRRVPRLTAWVVGGPGTVTVPEHGAADGTRSPILTGHVVTRRKCFAVRLRAGQYVVHVGRIAPAVDHCALLSQSGLLCKHVHGVQFVEVARDQRRLGIVPGPTADAVASIHGLGGSRSD